MSGSFALEKQLRIGYLGPAGSFSHAAAIGKFGSSVEYMPLTEIVGVFEAVIRGHCDYGLVPIENSLHGGVIDTLDAFLHHSARVCAEVLITIHHNLLAKEPWEKIKAIRSKPEVFSQCREWLSTTAKDREIEPSASTSRAAEELSLIHISEMDRLYGKLGCVEKDGKMSYEDVGYCNLDLFASIAEEMEHGLRATMSMAMISAWTAFEVLAEDIWVAALNERPRLGFIALNVEPLQSDSEVEKERKRNEKVRFPAWMLQQPDFVIQKNMGTALAHMRKWDFARRDHAQDAYCRTCLLYTSRCV